MAAVAYGYTHPVRKTLKRLGGKWDRDLRIWIFDSQPEAKLTDIYFAPHSLPQNWRIVNSYRAGLPAGKVVRKLLAISKSPENYRVICVQ